MIIERVGGYCFKISAGKTSIAVNPPAAKSAHKVNKFGADIALISVRHIDWDGPDTAAIGDKEPFVASGPGEYEVGDITISGFSTPTAYDGDESEYGNTAYVFEMDGIRVLVLGACSNAKLPADLREEAGDIGIAFVPVGGGTLEPKAAHELMVALEPKIIIPYAVGAAADMTAFLKAEGESPAPVDKLTVRAKEVLEKDGEVVLLS